MRIIAGSRKGARIFAPKGAGTRPTGDRVREAAFNLVGPVDGAAVLDLFAGSGAMGLEALSRGAASAVLVESDREAVRAIERNVDKLGLAGVTVVRRDVLQALATDRRAYDLILCDPPYGYAGNERLATYLVRALAPDGLLVYETGVREMPEIQGLRIRTSRTYGSARLTLLEHEP
ncbi:MAG TPA: 16S rRNA (guanine(966)-N(2))-methyltransferase RsmD [Gaiellaceae bacterium]|nr:16S rRNA (guanine(966)-N(2))-methyltransferase RsmD [Gaiellaceae bacterium]